MRYESEKFLPNNMSSRPGYTSGRGATISDLDSDRLSHIHAEIEKNVSKEAAENFVDMVADLEVASCTGFLLALYQLETDNWKYTKREKKDRNDIYCENEGEAFGCVASSLFGGNTDDTLRIVGPFLNRFGIFHEASIDENGIYTDMWGRKYTSIANKKRGN
jgi:hypothetical protein